MKNLLGMSPPQLSQVFSTWNEGDLYSYLIQITDDILQKRDPEHQNGSLVDFIRESHAQKRGGEAAPVSLDDALNVAQPSDPSGIQIHAALNALAEMDARKARVLEMRFFGGLTAEEIAHIENMSPVTVTRDVRAATAWLRAWLTSPEQS